VDPGQNCSGYPSVLFNRMVAPVMGRGLRAIIWYQGEANSNEGFPLARDAYGCLMTAMGQAWRKASLTAGGGGSTAWVIVQISAWFGNWGFDDLPCTSSYCPVITRVRQGQTDAVSGAAGCDDCDRLTNAGVAISHDFGDDEAHGVHSRFKAEPARRVSLQLRKLALGELDLVADLPAPSATLAGRPAVTGRVSSAAEAVEVVRWTHTGFCVTTRLSGAFDAVQVTVPLEGGNGGLRAVETTMCNETYSGTCCEGGDSGVVMGRLCTVRMYILNERTLYPSNADF